MTAGQTHICFHIGKKTLQHSKKLMVYNISVCAFVLPAPKSTQPHISRSNSAAHWKKSTTTHQLPNYLHFFARRGIHRASNSLDNGAKKSSELRFVVIADARCVSPHSAT
jgi:hypothetical protein